jgi:hypothetical protein
MIVLTATSLLFFFLLGLLAVNGAIAVASRTSAQRAADAGALAGCLDLPGTFPGQDPVGVARQYVESPQRNNTGGAASLHLEGRNQAVPAPQVSTTGATGANGGVLENNKITVWVQRSQRMFGITNVTVRAKAACTRQEGGAPVLHSLKNGDGSFDVEQAQLNLPRGGVVVGTQDCSPGDERTMTVKGGGSITARWIDLCTGGQPFLSQSSWINPPATHGWRCDEYGEDRPPVCRYVPEPSPDDRSLFPRDYRSQCPTGSQERRVGKEIQFCEFSSGAVPQGVYPGLRLRGDVTLNGNYYIDGNGMEVFGGANVSGQDVFIFIGPDGSGTSCGSKDASVTFSENSSFVVIPQTVGTYRDLVLFQSRRCTVQRGDKNKNSFDIKGGVTMGSPDPPYGVIYLPTAHIDIGPERTGGTQTVINMRVIAYEIRLRGPVRFGDIWIPSGDVNHGDVKLSE